MLHADISILYVKNVAKSVDFYSSLFGISPVESSPTFALFVFANGVKIGLWSKFTVEPSVNDSLSGCFGEIMFTVADKEMVDSLYYDWGNQHKVTMIQKPCTLDFGYTFAALDLDGHRLRICCLESDES